MFAFSNCDGAEAIVIYNIDHENGYKAAIQDMKNQFNKCQKK